MTKIERHALVTGTSSGIGAAIVRRLLLQGWRVTGMSRREADIDDPNYRHIAVNLTDKNALVAAVGGLEVTALIHAAGEMAGASLGNLSAVNSARMWQLHVHAAEVLADLLAPRLPEGSRIILVGSRVSAGAANRSQYAATKAALVAMARSWALELAPRGITVNVVAPAATETPMLHDPARKSVQVRLPPIGRLIKPEEVAATVAFLMSEEAGAITGQQILICGGSSL